MDGEYGTATPGLRVLRQVVPWMVLLALLGTSLVLWSGFQIELQRVASLTPSGASVVATPSAETSATSVPTSTIAVTRVDGVQLRAASNASAAVLSTVKKGTKLQLLNRTDTWLRVKDPSGHIGWIPNSVKSVEIRKK
jgi:SH3-like domain-containing protein